MKRRRVVSRIGFLVVALALVAGACGDDAETTTTQAQATTTTQAGTTTTTQAGTTTTEVVDFGDPVTLTLGHPFPAEHPIHQGALLPFAEAVNEATDGTVTIEFHPGGALGPPNQVYDNVVVGAQDLGWALQGYTAGRFPITDVIELPFQFDSATQATDVLWTLFEEFPEFQAEYSDVKVLGLWVHDIGDLWTADKQVVTMEDIAGLTLRAPSPIQNAVIEALGGTPIGLPAPELFDALERGVIDGLMIANSGLSSFNLYPVLNYGVVCNCYVAAQFLTLNLDAWNSLSPAQQAAIDELAGRNLATNAATVYDGAYDRALQRVQEEGIEQTVLGGDELARWKEAVQVVIDNWIASQGDLGQRMFDRMQELIGS